MTDESTREARKSVKAWNFDHPFLAATVIALLSLLLVLLGQLSFPVLGPDKSEEAPSTNYSESPKRARDEGRLPASAAVLVRCFSLYFDAWDDA